MTTATFVATSFTGLQELPIEHLRPADDNPRSSLGDLDELVASIHAVGIIEPLVVTANGPHGYTVVAGHRRLAAAFEAGLLTVPCISRAFNTTAERVEVMLIENMARASLSPLDEAAGFAHLVKLGHSQRKIAERVGCNQSHISRRIKLGELIDPLKAKVAEGKLDLRVAERAAGLPVAEQEDLAKKPSVSDYDVSDAERKIAQQEEIIKARADGLIEVDAYGDLGYCQRDKATHFINRNGYVQYLFERPVDELHDGPVEVGQDDQLAVERPKHQWEIDRDRKAAVIDARRQMVARLVDDEPELVKAVAFEVMVEEITSSDAYDELIVGARHFKELFPETKRADLTDDHQLYIAAVMLATLTVYADVESDEEYAELAEINGGDIEARAYRLWRRLSGSMAPMVDQASEPEVAQCAGCASLECLNPEHHAPCEAAEHRTIEIDNAEGGYDVIPGVIVPIDEPTYEEAQADIDQAIAEQEAGLLRSAENLHNVGIIEHPLWAQTTPWPGYMAAKEHALITRIGKQSDERKLHHVITYEWADATRRRRADILVAAVEAYKAATTPPAT